MGNAQSGTSWQTKNWLVPSDSERLQVMKNRDMMKNPENRRSVGLSSHILAIGGSCKVGMVQSRARGCHGTATATLELSWYSYVEEVARLT